MKKWIAALLFLVLIIPLLCQAGIPGFMKERMGILSGQVVTEDGRPLAGGVVSFFITEKGIPPLIVGTHRIPDMVGRMSPEGKFATKLLPGSYYMGALVITDPGRGPGPPREGEAFYFARGKDGSLREFTLGIKETKDAGKIIAALPDSFPLAKNLVTIKGRLMKDDGKPFAGGVVLVKTDMNSARPDFVSGRTGDDGIFTIQLPAGTPYYLLGRERTVGRPVPGTYIGTYGSNSAISQGGALPIGNVRPAQPASGMPEVTGVEIGPGEDLPATVMGKGGETLTGIDILMFKMPVPGEQREQLQGTLGFGEEKAKEMDKAVPRKE
ncbi:hypothetical protein ACFLYW_03920 [Thermodesulfobacteriota bacterium]